MLFDDDPEKIGKFIHGIEVKGKIDMMPLLLRNTMVTEIILQFLRLIRFDARKSWKCARGCTAMSRFYRTPLRQFRAEA